MKHLVGGLLAIMISSASATAAPAEKPVSIVLVHGAFVDASGWRPVYDILTGEGYEVLMVQNPTVTLDGDAEATRQVIARAKHPVVLVGHSYGGVVITKAGGDAKVKSLVYLAAYAPDEGESLAQLAAAPSPGEDSAPLLPPSDGFLLVDPQKFPTAFAADVDRAMTRFMAAAQVPWGLAAVEAKISDPAWKKKPTYFLVTARDHMIPPSKQRTEAARAKAKTLELQSSHAVMLAHPKEVAAFIRGAAEAAK